jgi:hypothetical protein
MENGGRNLISRKVTNPNIIKVAAKLAYTTQIRTIILPIGSQNRCLIKETNCISLICLSTKVCAWTEWHCCSMCLINMNIVYMLCDMLGFNCIYGNGSWQAIAMICVLAWRLMVGLHGDPKSIEVSLGNINCWEHGSRDLPLHTRSQVPSMTWMLPWQNLKLVPILNTGPMNSPSGLTG